MAKCTICGKSMMSGYCVCDKCYAAHFAADKLAQVEVHGPDLPDRSGMRELVRLANLNPELEIIWAVDTKGFIDAYPRMRMSCIKSVELGAYVTAGYGKCVHIRDNTATMNEIILAVSACEREADARWGNFRERYNALDWKPGIIVRIV